MESDFLTVDTLREMLNKASEYGYGDMKIKCQDDYLHDDEITFVYSNREILLRGCLFNSPNIKKVQDFKNGVDKLYKKLILNN